ncbi:hypothetical protein BJX61DRAFT_530342 [Aspergillus egyptiacus]|nr:hypothetical protein BJX61DRAFT_530342 [Aspergillus egyptiacus]
MKLSLVALTSILALVAAQEETSSTSAAPSATASLTPEESCILRCDDTDRCCKAACVGVPCPSDQMANDTNTCVAECDQGSGSEADTEAYAQCQARCYTTHFFPGTATLTSGPSSTSTESAATTTDDSDNSNSDDSNSADSNNDDSSPSETTGDSASETNSGDEGEPTNAAAKLGVSAAGLFGLLLTAWAL